jgi:hypothetical protein
MHRRVRSLLLLFVLTAAGLAQYGASSQPGVKLRSRSFADLYAAQRVLLSSYCRLDFEGARLQPTGWIRFKPFTSLRTNPEFTRVIIVTRFAIETPEQPTEQLDATYQAVGFYEEGEGYTTSSSNDRVTFRMQEQNGDLVVTNVSPETPHVSPQAAIAWMSLRLADPNTSELERAHLKDAMNQLNKLLPQSHPVTTTPGQ